MSSWQLVQRRLPWTDASKAFASTWIRWVLPSGPVDERVGTSWHEKQSELSGIEDTAAAPGVATALIGSTAVANRVHA